jgi:hypothetical protein
MNDSPRSDLFAALAELSRQYPHWRMGQLLANLADWAEQDIWHIDDDQMLQAAKLHLEHLASRLSEPVSE